jgi:hypothetical protein
MSNFNIFLIFKVVIVLSWVSPKSLRQKLLHRPFILDGEPKEQGWRTGKCEAGKERKSTSVCYQVGQNSGTGTFEELKLAPML